MHINSYSRTSQTPASFRIEKKRFALEQIFLKGIKNNIEMGKRVEKKARKKTIYNKNIGKKTKENNMFGE